VKEICPGDALSVIKILIVDAFVCYKICLGDALAVIKIYIGDAFVCDKYVLVTLWL